MLVLAVTALVLAAKAPDAGAAGPCHTVSGSTTATVKYGKPWVFWQSGSFNFYTGTIAWGDGQSTPIAGGSGRWTHYYLQPAVYHAHITGNGSYGSSPPQSCSDDQTFTIHVVRDKPKTRCTKGGKRVLCADQRRFLKALMKNAKAADRLNLDKLRRAVRRAKGTPREEAAREAFFKATLKMYDLITGKWDRLGLKLPPLPIDLRLPRDAEEWKRLGIDLLQKRAEDKYGDTRLYKLFEFAKEGDATLRYTNELLQDADAFDASHPGELDQLARAFCDADFYRQCSPQGKFAVASNVTNLTGAKNKLINHAVAMEVAGGKVTFSLPGKF